MLAAACGGGDEEAAPPSPTLVEEPAPPAPAPPAEEPAAEPPAIEPLGTLETSVGTLVVEEIQIADRFPPDCVDAECFAEPAEGNNFLIVWLAPAGGGDTSEIRATFDAPDGVAVTAADGSEASTALCCLLSGRLFVAFSVLADAQGFTLTWPGNEPVVLGP